MASLNQISLRSGLVFYLEANTLFVYRLDIVLLCPFLLLYISILCFWHFSHFTVLSIASPSPLRMSPYNVESVKRKLSLCAHFGYLWLGEAPRLGWAAPETAAVLTQEGDHGRWAWHRVRGTSVELGTTLLHAVMGNATAGCAAVETWSFASFMPRHLCCGGSSTQKHPHDVTIKGTGGCNPSPTSTPPQSCSICGAARQQQSSRDPARRPAEYAEFPF